MNNDATAREYLSLYRQHFNMMQSFYDLNNNIIMGINNALSLQRPNRRHERNFMQMPFMRPAIPPPRRWPPPPPPPPPPQYQPSNISPILRTHSNFDNSRNSTRTNTGTNTGTNTTFFNLRTPPIRPPSRRRGRHRC